MNGSLIAVRYASALFQLGKEDAALLDRLYSDCSFMLASVRESNDLAKFLEDPIIKPGIKKETLHNIFAKQLDDFSMRFLDVIIDNNRERLLENALLDFIDLYREYKAIKSVTIITAVPIGDDFKQYVRKFIEDRFKCQIELDCNVRPGIIGGLVLLVDGKQADGSVMGQLRVMKKKMMIN